MLKSEIENKFTSIAAWGSLGVALIVTDRVSTEPVNVGKMILLVCVSFASFSIVLSQLRRRIVEEKILLFILSGFLFFCLLSIFLSSNTWVKGFYGTFGRNTGFLTYFSLSLLLLAFSKAKSRSSFRKIIQALLFTGYVNIVLSLLELKGVEIFTWNNPYGNLLGTFGNPDFISAFMGIFVSALLVQLFRPVENVKTRLIKFLLVLIGVIVVLETKALQGLVVIAVGLSIVLYFFIRSYFNNRFLNITYLVVAAFCAVVGILGTLQIGPLDSILYKPSVSFRGEYWSAGIRMGFDNLITGVGLDSYGTYYRLYRDSSAIISPGANVVTDTSHNVFIDIFAGVGGIGFLFYIAIWLMVIMSAYSVLKRQKDYDAIFITLLVVWITYQIQSFVSINQIGLAVWGWLFGGAIIAYSRLNLTIENQDKAVAVQKKKEKSLGSDILPASTSLNLAIFVGIALVISLPPFIADAKMRTAFSSKDANKVTLIAKSWPLDSLRLNRASVELANAGIRSNALELSSIATKAFPEDFVGWYTIYELTPSANAKKTSLMSKLHSLDPLNPNFK